MEAGLPLAPAAEICTFVLYVPAARLAGLIEIESVPGAAPEAGDTATQYSLVDAVHERLPPPVFVIDTSCAAGAEPPIV